MAIPSYFRFTPIAPYGLIGLLSATNSEQTQPEANEALRRFIISTFFNCLLHLQSFVEDTYDLGKRLIGSSIWRKGDLSKPLIFVVDNQDWEMRCALLSTPILPSLNRSSKALVIQ